MLERNKPPFASYRYLERDLTRPGYDLYRRNVPANVWVDSENISFAIMPVERY